MVCLLNYFSAKSHTISFDFILQVDKSLPGFPDWTVLSTPGHTAVDTTIMNPENSIAYIGDCIIKTGQRIIPPYPINHPEKYKASLTTLRDLEIQTCLLAHHGSLNIKPITFNQLISSVPRRPKNHRNSILKMLGIST